MIKYVEVEAGPDQLETAHPDNKAFDENSFHFKLVRGGDPARCIHSDVLIASATFRSGEMEGLPVPLHCTWYNISPDANEFIQI